MREAGALNVLHDLGLQCATELTVKAQLAITLNDLIDQHGLSRTDVATASNLTQHDISQIRGYALGRISSTQLRQALASLLAPLY